MRRAAVAVSTALLTSCATLPAQKLGWYCTADAAAGPIRAKAFRLLDVEGRLRTGRAEWYYNPGNQLVDAQAEWQLGQPILDYREARVTIRHHVLPPADLGQLVVYTDVGTLRAPFAKATVRSLELRGEQLMALRDKDTSFGVHTYNPRGQLMGGSGIEWTIFDQSLALARRLDAQTSAKASDYRRQCQREERIIVT